MAKKKLVDPATGEALDLPGRPAAGDAGGGWPGAPTSNDPRSGTDPNWDTSSFLDWLVPILLGVGGVGGAAGLFGAGASLGGGAAGAAGAAGAGTTGSTVPVIGSLASGLAPSGAVGAAGAGGSGLAGAGAASPWLAKNALPAATFGVKSLLDQRNLDKQLDQQKDEAEKNRALTESQLDPYRQNMSQVRDLGALDRLAKTDFRPRTARPTGPWKKYGPTMSADPFYMPSEALIAAALQTQKHVATGRGGAPTGSAPSTTLDLSGAFDPNATSDPSLGNPWLATPRKQRRRPLVPALG